MRDAAAAFGGATVAAADSDDRHGRQAESDATQSGRPGKLLTA